MSDPTNTDEIIDSRDVISRIEELEGERDSYQDDLDSATKNLRTAEASLAEVDADDENFEDLTDEVDEATEEVEVQQELLDDWDRDYGDELKALKAFAEEAEGYCEDWRHGATLIHQDYFTEYAEQLADDLGGVNRESTWPNNHIDWEAAADDLRQDYTAVEFDGTTYWVR